MATAIRFIRSIRKRIP
ncbi:hypothetical protein KIPB_009734, partial [Kipferlia bialata]